MHVKGPRCLLNLGLILLPFELLARGVKLLQSLGSTNSRFHAVVFLASLPPRGPVQLSLRFFAVKDFLPSATVPRSMSWFVTNRVGLSTRRSLVQRLG